MGFSRLIFISLLLILPALAQGQVFVTAFWNVIGTLTLGSFSITGLTGGADVTADAWLVNTTNPTVNFQTSSSATTYDVLIKDSTDTTTICSVSNTASTTVAVASCGLSNGTSYRAHVTAKSGSSTRVASNDGYSFTVDTTTPTANSITGITGASDSTADAWLVGGLVPAVNWNAFTGAASYDVTIKDSAGSTTVCNLQNTTATTFTFTGCTLVHGTSYRAYVTAKSASGFNSVSSSNDGFSFSVDNQFPGTFAINGITGGTDSVVDSTLGNGTDPTVNYGSSTDAYRYDVVIKDSTGTTTVCSALNQTGSPSAVTCGLTTGQTYKAYVTAKSISTYLTTAASNAGYSFTVGAASGSPAGNFSITGATGGSDSTADNWLTSGTTVTANWAAASGAQSYDVTIRNSADTSTVCATQNTTSTSFTFTGCTLVSGTSYLIKVVANNPPALTRAALNNGFSFQVVTSGMGYFSITGATGGSDSTADPYLMSGVNVIANWGAAANATSYDVTIRDLADTTDVCATANTASTSYNFSTCTLTANTSYLIKVVAKNAATSQVAVNNGYAFYLPASVNFCPSGTSNAKALIIYDSGGPSGNYSNSESCTFAISPPATASQIVLNFTSFASNDVGDVLTVYDGTSTAGTNLGAYKAQTTAPADNTATSGNMYLTWASGAANNAAGYNMNFRAVYPSPSAFSITGVSGGTDVTANNVLTDNSSGVTVAWGASTNAASYDVVIRNSTNTADICAKANTTSTSYSFSSCTLMSGASYVALVYAKSSNGTTTAASNNPYTFKYDIRPTTFTITGITGGTDASADAYLSNGTTPTVNWSASSNQTTYDVAIYESDGYTEKCPKVTVYAGVSSYNFSSCTLVLNSSYKAEVIAQNGNGGTPASNSTFSFQVVAAAWQPTSLTSAPVARNYQQMVWTGSEMIVWGGDDSGNNYLNTGGRYNPTTDSWLATSTGTNVPVGRDSYAMVWTGSEVIVWGGYVTAGYTNTGGRYNPSSDSWLATSTGTNVPSARAYPGYVWTGTEMIIFGGETTSYFNSGGRYNPSTNSWLATSTTSAPTARGEVYSFWTGTEMLVWGGYNGAWLNTGGRYTPSSNSWVAMSTTSAPSARGQLAGVWTGTEMIVWGGSSSATYYNSGGRYNPSTDTWVATSTGTNVPAKRRLFSAVWTGTEMVVWGGQDNVNVYYLNTGGRYNPTTDSWLATDVLTNVPAGRQSPSAVWTGTKMIIWGGTSSSGGYLNSGGVLTLQ